MSINVLAATAIFSREWYAKVECYIGFYFIGFENKEFIGNSTVCLVLNLHLFSLRAV